MQVFGQNFPVQSSSKARTGGLWDNVYGTKTPEAKAVLLNAH